MYNKFGLSLYLSSFEDQRDMLEKLIGSKYYVFTSFHFQEELNSIDDYKSKSKEMCSWLHDRGFRIIGDVSPKTLQFFEYDHVIDFALDMNIDVLRLDYGFSDNQIIEISKAYPIAFNASTVDEKLAKKIIQVGSDVFALHNYYPRPETGLDNTMFQTINTKLMTLGIKVLAFIPGDALKRGPLYEGLPTLEEHRKIPPYLSFLDLAINYHVSVIFVGDLKLSSTQSTLIREYMNDGIINIPVNFEPNYEYLYNQTFTIRIDSPHAIMRLQESREYSCSGKMQLPYNCIDRAVGSITMDNQGYKRYSGEIQVVRTHLPQDDRVNVIGSIDDNYHSILKCIKNGHQIKFINLT